MSIYQGPTLLSGGGTVDRVPAVIEQNKQLDQKFWRGTRAEYDSLQTRANDTMYIITNETGEGNSPIIKKFVDDYECWSKDGGKTFQPVCYYYGLTNPNSLFLAALYARLNVDDLVNWMLTVADYTQSWEYMQSELASYFGTDFQGSHIDGNAIQSVSLTRTNAITYGRRVYLTEGPYQQQSGTFVCVLRHNDDGTVTRDWWLAHIDVDNAVDIYVMRRNKIFNILGITSWGNGTAPTVTFPTAP